MKLINKKGRIKIMKKEVFLFFFRNTKNFQDVLKLTKAQLIHRQNNKLTIIIIKKKNVPEVIQKLINILFYFIYL